MTTATTITVEFHVAVKQRFTPGGYPKGATSIRTSKGKPSCDFDEVAVAIRLELPASLFKRPQLSANIVVPEGHGPMVITPDIQQNIADVVRDQLGITLRVEAPEVKNADQG